MKRIAKFRFSFSLPKSVLGEAEEESVFLSCEVSDSLILSCSVGAFSLGATKLLPLLD